MLVDASAETRHAWTCLACHCKATGIRGEFRFHQPSFCAYYRLSMAAVDDLLARARKFDAIEEKDGMIFIVNWGNYQEVSTARVQRHREKMGKPDTHETDETFHSLRNTTVDRRQGQKTGTEDKTPPTPLAGGVGSLPAETTKPRARAKREPKPPTPGHAEAKAAYFTAFESRYGARPPWSGRDAVVLNDILASFNGEPSAAVTAIARYFRDADQFVASSGHPLALFRSRLGRYTSELPSPRTVVETRVGEFFPSGHRRT